MTDFILDVRESGYLNILPQSFRGNWRVIWRSDVYRGRSGKLKNLNSSFLIPARLVKARIESFPQASTVLILVIEQLDYGDSIIFLRSMSQEAELPW